MPTESLRKRDRIRHGLARHRGADAGQILEGPIVISNFSAIEARCSARLLPDIGEPLSIPKNIDRYRRVRAAVFRRAGVKRPFDSRNYSRRATGATAVRSMFWRGL